MEKASNTRSVKIPSDDVIRGLHVGDTLELAKDFDIDTTNLPFKEIKRLLMIVRALCDGRKDSIRHVDLLTLYKNLRLNSIEDLKSSRREHLLEAIGNHYVQKAQ